jgi:hypothetical protein
MPKRFPRHNPEGPRLGSKSVSNSRTPLRTPVSVNSLLSRVSQSALGRVATQRQAQQDWRSWLKNRLSGDIESHITGISESGDALTVFADSAAWSARLRFAVAEIEDDIRQQNAAIRKVVVKVLPRR